MTPKAQISHQIRSMMNDLTTDHMDTSTNSAPLVSLLAVLSHVKSTVEGLHKAAKESVEAAYVTPETRDNMFDEAKQFGKSVTNRPHESDVCVLSLKTRAGAKYTNMDTLKALLIDRHGMSAVDVMRLFDDATDYRNPTIVISAEFAE